MKHQPKIDDAAIETAAPVPEAEPRYFNRELSWLAFNRRVLEEACNVAHPLLERLRFLSISASNLDEFFMVRVAGLKAHQALGIEKQSNDGLTPNQQLSAVTSDVDRLVADLQEAWTQLRESLVAVGVCVADETPLDAATETWLDKHFREQIFPLLTPQAIDPAHPFPFIPNRGFSLIFEIRRGRAAPVHQLIMLPVALPRFIRLPGRDSRFIALETLIRRKTDYLFPKYQVLGGLPHPAR
jgi:polyphosphate kinase